jgi:hypothetical protein
LRIPKIYLDTCCYNRPFDNQEQIKIRLETEAKLFIQAGIRKSRYTLVWSYMLDYENDNNPYDEKRVYIASWKLMAKDYCQSSEKVLSRGQEIMKRIIKPKDALPFACAISCSCEYFVTTDSELTKKLLPDLKIFNPINFIIETENIL